MNKLSYAEIVSIINRNRDIGKKFNAAIRVPLEILYSQKIGNSGFIDHIKKQAIYTLASHDDLIKKSVFSRRRIDADRLEEFQTSFYIFTPEEFAQYEKRLAEQIYEEQSLKTENQNDN